MEEIADDPGERVYQEEDFSPTQKRKQTGFSVPILRGLRGLWQSASESRRW